ncbi:Transmembrane protein [Quillaja saponaria]|uniref:Transmembrane protein n=1 Tax=Quillaja saponaria TaxID=32244 RepID=A0AAD7LS46_QUISA|nr:Transmembrane protein [Quillaja saponaria]
MANNSLRYTLVALFIFAMVFSQKPSDAARPPIVERPICPACVCCTPPPPGSCCKCCASPIETQPLNYHTP